jgi:hypothetical protein
MPYPEWLHLVAWAYLAISSLCSLIVIVDEVRHPQKMFVMNIVWPITCLYFGPFALWSYFRSGKRERENSTSRCAERCCAT